jgi:hypothetical protein
MDLAALSDWLSRQNDSLVTHSQFARLSADASRDHPEQAAAARLLALLALRFFDRYDQEPLPAETAEQAIRKLRDLTAAAARVESHDSRQVIAVLNQIAVADLDDAAA